MTCFRTNLFESKLLLIPIGFLAVIENYLSFSESEETPKLRVAGFEVWPRETLSELMSMILFFLRTALSREPRVLCGMTALKLSPLAILELLLLLFDA